MKEKINRLENHILNLSNLLISELGDDGIIRTYADRETVYPDYISTHHLADYLMSLDNSYMFSNEIQSVIQSFHKLYATDPSPFVIDTYIRASNVSDENTELLNKFIISSQIASGAIIKYTGYLHGGDYFSTLWSLKILINYSKEIFKSEIEKAISYLLRKENYQDVQLKDKGFLGYILMRYDFAKHKKFINELALELNKYLLNATDKFEKHVEELINLIYIAEDLLIYLEYDKNDSFISTLNSFFNKIFELDKNAEKIPSCFDKIRHNYNESLYLQTLCRSCLTGYYYLKLNNISNFEFRLNDLIHQQYRQIRNYAIQTQHELKKYLSTYGKIHKEFEGYNEILNRIWDKHPFEKTIFLIMPFTDSLVYRVITDTIKKTCKENGFVAIRSDDNNRQFSDKLWDNLMINMLSAKYAIAIFSNDETNGDKIFSNPNVAFEFGFFKSRGQDILLLKENKAKLSSILQGHLWKNFDINNPERNIKNIITEWIKRFE